MTNSWGIFDPDASKDIMAMNRLFPLPDRMGVVPQYTFIASTLFGDRAICELPLTGVRIEWKVKEPGTLTGTLNFSTFASENLYFEATEPCKTVLYVIRNGVPMWGGIIWKRSFSGESRSMEISAETWDSYLKKRILADSIYIQKDRDGVPNPQHFGLEQIEIFRQMWLFMASSEYSDIGVVLGQQNSGVSRGAQFKKSDLKTFFDHLSQWLANLPEGFDWFATVGYSDDGSRIERRIEFAYPRFGRTYQQTGVVWEYPGNIANYKWSNDPEKSSTVAYVTGQGEGDKLVVVSKSNPEAHLNGYPRMDSKHDHKKQPEGEMLRSYAAKYLSTRRPPGALFEASSYPTVPTPVGGYFIGDEVRFLFKDDLFKAANIDERDLYARITGLSVSVPESGHEDVTPSFMLSGREERIIDPEDDDNSLVPGTWAGVTIVTGNRQPYDPSNPDEPWDPNTRRRLVRVPATGRGWRSRNDRGLVSLENASRYGDDPWGRGV